MTSSFVNVVSAKGRRLNAVVKSCVWVNGADKLFDET